MAPSTKSTAEKPADLLAETGLVRAASTALAACVDAPGLLVRSHGGSRCSSLRSTSDIASDEREHLDVLGGVVFHELNEQRPHPRGAKRPQFLAQLL